MATRTEFVNDRNIEDCFRWLNDQLRLTPEEEKIFNRGKKSCSFTPEVKNNNCLINKAKLEKEDKNFILNNYYKMTINGMSRELNKYPKNIKEFLDKRGLEAVKRYRSPNIKLRLEEIQFLRENCSKYSFSELSRIMHIERGTLTRKIRNLGLTCISKKNSGRPRKFSQHQIDEILEKRKHMTIKEIAKLYNSAVDTIARIIKENNEKAV